jgi:hypothetical protein
LQIINMQQPKHADLESEEGQMDRLRNAFVNSFS